MPLFDSLRRKFHFKSKSTSAIVELPSDLQNVGDFMRMMDGCVRRHNAQKAILEDRLDALKARRRCINAEREKFRRPPPLPVCSAKSPPKKPKWADLVQQNRAFQDCLHEWAVDYLRFAEEQKKNLKKWRDFIRPTFSVECRLAIHFLIDNFVLMAKFCSLERKLWVLHNEDDADFGTNAIDRLLAEGRIRPLEAIFQKEIDAKFPESQKSEAANGRDFERHLDAVIDEYMDYHNGMVEWLTLGMEPIEEFSGKLLREESAEIPNPEPTAAKTPKRFSPNPNQFHLTEAVVCWQNAFKIMLGNRSRIHRQLLTDAESLNADAPELGAIHSRLLNFMSRSQPPENFSAIVAVPMPRRWTDL